MTFRGQVRNGVVVFTEDPPLAEGTFVDVAPAAGLDEAPPSEAGQGPSWADVFGDVIGKAEGLPPDMARNHNHYIHGSPKR
jgi:hypothetical protein